MNTKRILHFILIAAVVFGLAACEPLKISEINADPGRYADKKVNVAGRVTQSFGFLGKGMYQIDDGTGKLWVMAEERGVPSQGAVVGVQGHITPTVTFMGKNYATVMRETNRRSGE